jgi:hygromycin-B 4-O-kinase
VLRAHFGAPVRQLQPLGGGLTNLVFRARAGRSKVVVRLHAEAGKVHDYLKEQWAIGQARAAGVPAPEVLEVGTTSDGRPFMLMADVDGMPGSQLADRLAVLRELGAHAARLHTVRTRGYGSVFDWSRNRLSKAGRWADWLDGELQAAERLQTLARKAALAPGTLRVLQRDLAAMRRWQKPPVLQHGDLRLKNVIVDPASGRIAALLDWEACMSAPGPSWDLSIALHDLGVDEKEAFLAGYGISPLRFEHVAPYVRLLNALHYAWALECAMRDGERERAAWLRARLKGVFDLAP